MHIQKTSTDNETILSLTTEEKSTLRFICKTVSAKHGIFLFPTEQEALLSVFKKLS